MLSCLTRKGKGMQKAAINIELSCLVGMKNMKKKNTQDKNVVENTLLVRKKEVILNILQFIGISNPQPQKLMFG